MPLSRRRFLRGISLTGAVVRVGLPPLAAMFNSSGTAYAAAGKNLGGGPIETRFLVWFNGNGIPERYWIPAETGSDYELTPCLAPLKSVREYVHVISGIDNVAARLNGQGNGHFSALCGLTTGTSFTGRGASGPSIRPAPRGQDRRQIALPFPSNRSRPGIARRERAPQYELGGLRARATPGDDSAESVRPVVRREERKLGRPQEERLGPGVERRQRDHSGPGSGRPPASRRAPDFGS